MTSEQLVVLDDGRELAFSFEDLLRYAGYGSPGGVAHAFKVIERALPLLAADGRAERREIVIETPFDGPGARDAFELVTRAVTENRYRVDGSLVRAAHGPTRQRFVFRLRYRERTITLALRDGFVTEEFVELAGRKSRSADEEQRLTELKAQMAERVMSAPAEEVYDAEDTATRK